MWFYAVAFVAVAVVDAFADVVVGGVGDLGDVEVVVCADLGY